jgi:DNA repair exonuclease SbcCD ATPase subunit
MSDLNEKMTFEFATRDDCLKQMVPSDLRGVIAERDELRAQVAELEKSLELCRKGSEIRTRVEERLQTRVAELETLLDEYKDSEHKAVKQQGEALKRVAKLERILEKADCSRVGKLRDDPNLVHCPIDRPCLKHANERLQAQVAEFPDMSDVEIQDAYESRIEKLEAQVAEMGAKLYKIDESARNLCVKFGVHGKDMSNEYVYRAIERLIDDASPKRD